MKKHHLVGALLVLALPGSLASAHIVFDQPAGTAGGYYAGFLRVTHGCGASPTVAIRVEIPAAIATVRPQPKPGWTVKIDREALASPFVGEGGATVSERVTAITWTGSLPAEEFDQFGLSLKLPPRAGPLYFPTHQVCALGRADWVAIPATADAWGRTDHPAPFVTIAAAQASGMVMGH